MANDNSAPKKICVLSTNKQIKGYVHPTRIVLIKMLAKEKRTISSIAKELGVHPANITHHFKLLEKVGLILLVEKRDTGRNIEKYYRATAYNFVVKPKSESNKKATALSILKNDLSVAINSVNNDKSKDMIALLETARINPEDRITFFKKLKKLIEEFKSCDTKDGTSYNINLSLYPNDINCAPQEEIIIE